MHPSSSASRVGSRAVTVKYAHSPYAYRTSVDDGPTSPMSDMGRQDSTSSPQYHSPRSLSQSGAYGEGSGLLHAAGSHTDLQSQPSSPLGRSAPGQEYSQPIQVGSAPNVHPRYRRGMQSPMSRPGLDSGSRSGFPTSPSSSLPPRSPFMGRDEGTSSFNGGESAPVRGSNNPYRMHATTGVSAPQYSVPLSGSFRGGNQSGTQSPGPHHSRQPSTSGMPMGGNPNNNTNNSQSNSNNCSTTQNYSQAMNSSGTAAPYYAPPTPASSMSGATPHYGSSNNNGTAGGNTYAPTGFSMPPAMAAGNASSFHGSPSGRGGSQCPTLADSRSSHPSSPLQSASNRLAVGSAMHQREPTSPNHQFSSSGTAYGGGGGLEGGAYSPSSHHHSSLKSGGANGAPPPAFATAMSQQQSSGGFGVGSFPGRRAQGPPGHSPSSPYSNSHMNASGHDVSLMSESYGTNTKTLSTMADDTVSSSGKSGSSASSIRDDLPLCPTDDACTMINDRKHQKKYAHTCRLFPCYHGHVTRHAKLFRHAPGQISFPEGLSANAKVSSQALASVNFSTISPEAPNAYRIYVSHADKSYEIFGDWASVKVHTFKRYLHQVYHIAPGSQVLSVLKTGKVMDDDINSVKCYGIEEDSVIVLRSDSEDGPATGKMRIPLDDL